MKEKKSGVTGHEGQRAVPLMRSEKQMSKQNRSFLLGDEVLSFPKEMEGH